MYQKTMFDRYYCINSFCHLKTFEKCFEKLFFYYYNGAQKHDRFVGFENARSRAKTYVIITSLISFIYMQVTIDDVFFSDGLVCVLCKEQKPCINST